MIPYGRQTIEEDDIQAVVEVLKSDYLTTGPKVEEFEEAFADYVGTKYAVSFSSGTAALHGAVNAVNPRGDPRQTYEIITTPVTFVATANSILYSNFRPEFVDVEHDTLLLDHTRIEDAITDRTIAILSVDYAGQPCDYDALRNIAYKHNLILVADACHSLGATYKGVRVGNLADMTVFSFHPVKIITTGEGGMVTTNREDTAEFLRAFRNHGRYDSITKHLGFNYRLTDIQCALGLSQLRKIGKFLTARRDIAAIYDSAFNKTDKIIPLSVKENVGHAYHLYVVKIPGSGERDRAIKFLNAAGVTTTIHYPLIFNYHKLYRYHFRSLPYAQNACCILSLPIYPTLSLSDQMTVINTLMQL